MDWRDRYDAVAAVLVYPDETLLDRIDRAKAALEAGCPGAAAELEAFRKMMAALSRPQQEELFLRSFDVQALTTLDIGYVLFGDDYKRGELLANLNREHEAVGLDPAGELSDHLPNILRLLVRMTDADLRIELVREIVFPALRRMDAEFDLERVQRKAELYRKHYKTLIEVPEHFTAYRCPLAAVLIMLRTDFPVADAVPSIEANEFIRVLEPELNVDSVTGP